MVQQPVRGVSQYRLPLQPTSLLPRSSAKMKRTLAGAETASMRVIDEYISGGCFMDANVSILGSQRWQCLETSGEFSDHVGVLR